MLLVNSAGIRSLATTPKVVAGWCDVFQRRCTLREVTLLPDTATVIGDNAFSDCSSLRKVTVFNVLERLRLMHRACGRCIANGDLC
jgi:hypothetical protein